MKPSKPHSNNPTSLREKAEKKLREQTERLHKLSSQDIKLLIHELGTHQIELEMQNEELRRAQEELEASRSRYSDLYDFAPIGYFTFDTRGLIKEVNLTGANMLGIERRFLVKKLFSLFIADMKDRDIFYTHLREILIKKTQQACELKLKRKNGSVFYVQLQSIAVGENESNYCRTAVSDITDRKQADEALHRAHNRLEKLIRQRTSELVKTNEALMAEVTDRRRTEEALRDSHEQLRNLSAHLQSAREEEKMNIAREIHDELGQVLTVLKIDLSMLITKLYPGYDPLLEKTESVIERIDETIQSVKRICADLRPAILDHFGLSAAIEWQAEEFENKTGIICDVSLEPKEIIVDQDLTNTIFRIFQETLTNVARHAKATEVKVNLRLKDGKLMFEVKDNGKGITEKQINCSPKSFGLLGIRERVRHRGGRINIKGIQNKGTTVTVSIPLQVPIP